MVYVVWVDIPYDVFGHKYFSTEQKAVAYKLELEQKYPGNVFMRPIPVE